MKTRKIKKIARKKLIWWVHWLGLGYWHVQMVFSMERQYQTNGYLLVGSCECDWKYQTACITLYPKALRHASKSEIEKAVLHELMHIFLNEMHEGEMHHEERVATQLQKAFSWVKGAK